MSPAGHLLPPSSSLPPPRSLTILSEDQIFSALDNLQELYCPVSLSRAVKSQLEVKQSHDNLPTQPLDSGYVSEDDNEERNKDEDDIASENAIDALRADIFERNFVIRWLTTLIARVGDLFMEDDDERERAVDKASYVLASFTKAIDEDDDDDNTGITRVFSFDLALSHSLDPSEHYDSTAQEKIMIEVRLNDGPHTTADHTDVGLQSWGASIVFSELLCASPALFDLAPTTLSYSPRIVELGAGTGLVSLVLDKALPHLGFTGTSLIATDYHPAVLANLEFNIKFGQADVQACTLDWSTPVMEAPLDKPADMLIATDVVYAPEHAIWLRSCATRLLSPDGVFWLMMTVRLNGRFEAVVNSVETSFQETYPKAQNGRYLTILSMDNVTKRRGVGRGDESGYKLFRIGWA
ncbi:putative methyltransferase-domain-containing protein [Hypoxylon sp. NC1633]|nr:putative methyltransferase-domain-containing protein [Hypoxylon sp. NC1633]